jgi:hypothetical protein
MVADILLNDLSASGGLKWERMIVEWELQVLQTKGKMAHVVYGIRAEILTRFREEEASIVSGSEGAAEMQTRISKEERRPWNI